MRATNEMTPTVRPVTAAAGRTMRAMVYREYGEPDVLAAGEVARPVPGPDDVLVRVFAAGASVGDHHVVTGKPYLIRLTPYGGLPRPKNPVPGTAVAGRVEAVGANVTTVQPGDEVCGEARNGAFAEYVVLPASRVAPKATNLSFEDAAATPWAVTALQGLRDAGRLRAGQSVLINGASGGLGTWAVQIAKALGARVTAVCSTRNVEMVRALGADEVIDYTKQDFVAGAARFDLMFDVVGNRSISDCKRVLSPRGTYVASSGGGGDWVGPIFRILGVMASSLFSRKRLTSIIVSPNRRDLLFIKELVESGKAKPVIERRYPLSEVGEALRHIGGGHTQGQTIIRVAG
jgi:NADPH:quinone reductase-like Zn-dependent oxidoreductase